MASAEPTAEAVADFVAFTNVSNEKAIIILRAHNCDSQRAINAYFENPDDPVPNAQTGAGQQPESYAYHGPSPQRSFDIERIDMDYDAAPSRPPSRTGNKEQREGATINEAVETTVDQNQSAAGKTSSNNNMTLAEREEHDMQQAMAMSLNYDFDSSGQETGVTNADGAKFGPASRDHYDENAWALTLHDTSSRETCIDPDPEERKRMEGKPAFLRPSEDAEYMPGLITIFHAIPLVRETLLQKSTVVSNYGHDPQWWNGQPISSGRQVTDDGVPLQDYTEEAIKETQRLMAFLDGTDRAFGSIDALANSKAIGGWNSEHRILSFFKLWDQNVTLPSGEEGIENIFFSVGTKQTASTGEKMTEEFPIINIPVDNNLNGGTLYDALDQYMWADIPEKELDDVWLERIAPVFAIRISNLQGAKPLGIKIPAIWYPDRYMAECKEFATELRNNRLKVDTELQRLHGLVDRFKSAGVIGRQDMSFDTLAQTVLASSRVALNGRYEDHPPEDEGVDVQPITATEIESLVGELKATSDKINAKVKALEERKKEAIESLRQLSKQLTTSSSNPDASPNHRYTLRGVCTLSHVVYVLKRDSNDPDRMTDSPPGAANDEWKWWRISFSADDAKTNAAERSRQSEATAGESAESREKPRPSIPSHMDVAGYTAQPVREVEVLRAARDESHSAILVYASDDAVNHEEAALPGPLQEFVDQDNASFKREIEDFIHEITMSDDNTKGITPDEPSTGLPHTGGDAEPEMGELFDDDTIPSSSQEMQELSPSRLLSPKTRGRETTARSGSMDRIKEESNDELDQMQIDMEQRSAPAA